MPISAATQDKFPNSLWVTLSSITATALLGVGFTVPYVSRIRRRKILLQQMQQLEKNLLKSNSSSLEAIDSEYKDCQKLWNQFQYNIQMDLQQNKLSRISFGLSHLKHILLKTVVEFFDHSEGWYMNKFRRHKQTVVQTIIQKYLNNTEVLQTIPQDSVLQGKVLQFFKDALYKTTPTPLLQSLLQQFQSLVSTSWNISLWIQVLQKPSAAKQILESQIQEAKHIHANNRLQDIIDMIEYLFKTAPEQSKVEWIVLFEQTIDWLYYHWMTVPSLNLETIQNCIRLLEKRRTVTNNLSVKMDSLDKLIAKCTKYDTSLIYIELARSLQVENLVTRFDVFIVNFVNGKVMYIPVPIFLQNGDALISEQIWNLVITTIQEACTRKQVQLMQNIIYCLGEEEEAKYSSLLQPLLKKQFSNHSNHISQSFTVFLNSE